MKPASRPSTVISEPERWKLGGNALRAQHLQQTFGQISIGPESAFSTSRLVLMVSYETRKAPKG
jgi:hypothetical protein